jgi:hypothetical protein
VLSLNMTRPKKFLAASTIVFAIGLGGGGLAYAASSSGTPVLTPVRAGHAVKLKGAKLVTLKAAPTVVGSAG